MHKESTLQREQEIRSLINEAYETRISDLDKSTLLAQKALKASYQIENDQLVGACLSKLSLFNMIRGDYQLSKEQAEKAIVLFLQGDDELGLADAKYTIAGTLYKTDGFKEGLSHLMDCRVIYNKFKDFHNLARVHKSIGTIFEYYGDEKAAVKAYEAAIDCASKVQDLALASNAYNPLSGIYLNQGHLDKAEEIIEKSIAQKQETGDLRGLAFALYGRGKVHAKKALFKEAEADYLESIAIHKRMGEKLGVGMCLHKLGALKMDLGNLPEAEKTLGKALKFANANNIALIKFKCNYLLYELHKQLGESTKALFFLEQYVKAKELVINTQTFKLIESYESLVKIEAAEAEIQAQKEQATIIEKKNLELDAFFYRVSHDLKGPINALVGLDFVAREELKTPSTLKYLDMYKSQVHRINHILDCLIEVTRMNHLSELNEDIDFNKLIQECIESYHYLPNYDLVTFEVKVEQGINYQAQWGLVNTIIQNLIENAIKYVDPNKASYLNISVSQKSRNILLTVADNGLGMSEETEKSIFNMFYQRDGSSNGSGLGLFILSKAVNQLDGKISITTKESKGTKFEISLPN